MRNNGGKMRRILFLTSALALSACNSTSDVNEDEIKPVDFVDDKNALEKMWIVSKNDYPRYPQDAAKKGISGCVDFSFVINSEGKAQNIQVIKAIPDSTFIRSATKSLKNFRWQPTELNSVRQPAITTLQLDFSTTPVMKVAECIVGDA
ncbi:energy transducer TonB [Salinimonas sp. HHU 13199]|uniref:Protein TonB n=1 Tax=Salinimonas profundi TaxID=2729140 RepID=A0ABR8LT70_9ALTE|nr:energy transducer TonB [Salinimonas profundi]MBD3587360.1 energy transducer TonB [Salinimonas profundi]